MCYESQTQVHVHKNTILDQKNYLANKLLGTQHWVLWQLADHTNMTDSMVQSKALAFDCSLTQLTTYLFQ